MWIALAVPLMLMIVLLGLQGVEKRLLPEGTHAPTAHRHSRRPEEYETSQPNHPS
jgi:hypothetical protein